jgi:hypothetical protein
MHVLAIGYAPKYQSENGDGVRGDWPRIPMPASSELLTRSSAFGQKVAALLDTHSDVVGVTAGAIRTELTVVCRIEREDGSKVGSEKGELELTGWGHFGKGQAVMPGTGNARLREYSSREFSAIDAGASQLKTTRAAILEAFGKSTLDVFLNDSVCFSNIPQRVWEYSIGGYQVIKKWLSYRDKKVLGRPLSVEEVGEVAAMARRIAAILLLQRELDANYEAIKGSAFPWGSVAPDSAHQVPLTGSGELSH